LCAREIFSRFIPFYWPNESAGCVTRKKNQKPGIKKWAGIFFGEADKLEKKQFEVDAKHMTARLERIDVEIEKEPPLIEELYRVALNRLTPVRLVVLWPQTRL
jgi:hypothetical protein